jgi:molybdopterin-guanine dinucleotide biosynthesis protein A
MGSEKSLLRAGGVPLVQILARRLEGIVDEVLISANDPAVFAFLGLPVVADLFPGCGPMAGLHAAMKATSRELVLLLATDMPRVPSSLLKRLIELSDGVDAVIPQSANGILHPVCAAYRRTCLPATEDLLRRGERQMVRLLEHPDLRFRTLPPGEGGYRDEDLIDIDSPDDYLRFVLAGNA